MQLGFVYIYIRICLCKISIPPHADKIRLDETDPDLYLFFL